MLHGNYFGSVTVYSNEEFMKLNKWFWQCIL